MSRSDPRTRWTPEERTAFETALKESHEIEPINPQVVIRWAAKAEMPWRVRNMYRGEACDWTEKVTGHRPVRGETFKLLHGKAGKQKDDRPSLVEPPKVEAPAPVPMAAPVPVPSYDPIIGDKPIELRLTIPTDQIRQIVREELQAMEARLMQVLSATRLVETAGGATIRVPRHNPMPQSLPKDRPAVVIVAGGFKEQHMSIRQAFPELDIRTYFKDDLPSELNPDLVVVMADQIGHSTRRFLEKKYDKKLLAFGYGTDSVKTLIRGRLNG